MFLHDRQCVYIFHHRYAVKIAQCTFHVDARWSFSPSQQSCGSGRRSMEEDKSRLQRDIKELFGCRLGIESDKITERKVSENLTIKARKK